MRLIQYFLATVLTVTLSGCIGPDDPNSSPSPTGTPEQKTIVEEGVITPKEITIFENGTHYLTTAAGKKFLLKSAIIDLSRFENQQVAVTGETAIEPTEGEQTVITVFGVDAIGPPAEMRQSIITESELGFSIELPGNWQRTVSDDADPIVRYHPENEDPVITIKSFDQRSEGGIAAQQEMTSGIPVTISDKQGWRLLVPGGGIDVFVPLKDQRRIVVFHLIPGKNPELERATFYEMLTSLEWLTATASPTATGSPTSETVVYCGGVAKKLCPSGYRCELMSLEEGATGICVDSSLPPSDISASLSASPSPETSPIPDSSPSPTDSLTPSPTSSATLPGGWKQYTNERFEYSFAVPVAWWWRHTTPEVATALSRLEIATEEVTGDNSIAKIEIFPGNRTQRTEAVALGSITISLPRDTTTYFEVSGDAGYAQQIRTIADSLSSF